VALVTLCKNAALRRWRLLLCDLEDGVFFILEDAILFEGVRQAGATAHVAVRVSLVTTACCGRTAAALLQLCRESTAEG